jgi:hypothetical protein
MSADAETLSCRRGIVLPSTIGGRSRTCGRLRTVMTRWSRDDILAQASRTPLDLTLRLNISSPACPRCRRISLRHRGQAFRCRRRVLPGIRRRVRGPWEPDDGNRAAANAVQAGRGPGGIGSAAQNRPVDAPKRGQPAFAAFPRSWLPHLIGSADPRPPAPGPRPPAMVRVPAPRRAAATARDSGRLHRTRGSLAASGSAPGRQRFGPARPGGGQARVEHLARALLVLAMHGRSVAAR